MTSGSDFPLDYILVWVLKVVILFFAGSLTVLFVGLGIHKTLVQKREKKNEVQNALYKTRWPTLSEAEGSLAMPNDFTDAVNLAQVLSEIRKAGGGGRESANKQPVLGTGMHGILRKALQDKNWGKRFRSLTAFYDLGSPSEFDLLLDFISRERNIRVYGNALMAAAASISSEPNFDGLIRLMQKGQKISGSYYEGVFRVALRALENRVGRSAMVEQLEEILESPDYDNVLKGPLVLAVAKEKLRELKGSIVDLARRENNPVITISTLRSLRILGQYDEIIGENIGSPDRGVNLIALGASSNYRGASPVLLRRIAEQLRSPDYVVRYTAAFSLKELGEEGRDVLISASHGEDRYASDMASYILSLG